jgi:ubiquinone/menaquinone biosynthesis C-methylase UbiE
MSDQGLEAREREFYDRVAEGMGPEELRRRAPDSYDRSILDALGPLQGRTVLEAGCGAGELSLELVDGGAQLTGLDVSPRMIEMARRRVQRLAPAASVQWLAAPLEETRLPSEAFDVVVGKWVLHHVDVERAAAEVHRVLRPGGVAAFFENQARNKLLAASRHHLLRSRLLARVGTDDEHPLNGSDLEKLRGLFLRVSQEYPSLYLLELLSRSILRYRGHRWWQRADAWLWRRAPGLRPYGYHVLLRLTKAPVG